MEYDIKLQGLDAADVKFVSVKKNWTLELSEMVEVR
jgi:hypothetical protein